MSEQRRSTPAAIIAGIRSGGREAAPSRERRQPESCGQLAQLLEQAEAVGKLQQECAAQVSGWPETARIVQVEHSGDRACLVIGCDDAATASRIRLLQNDILAACNAIRRDAAQAAGGELGAIRRLRVFIRSC